MPTTEELRDSPPETLIGYIVGRHHARVRKVMPSILANADEAALTDGVLHPNLETLADRVACLMVDMTFHMQREETVVFPYIGALAAATQNNREPPHSPIASFEALIAVIERDHDALLDAMENIRELAAGYKAPGDAGAACRTWLKELEAFERELNLHLGIETDMLFPKARALALPRSSNHPNLENGPDRNCRLALRRLPADRMPDATVATIAAPATDSIQSARTSSRNDPEPPTTVQAIGMTATAGGSGGDKPIRKPAVRIVVGRRTRSSFIGSD